MADQRDINTVSDITVDDLITVNQVLQAIVKAGPLNQAKMQALTALNMSEYFDGSSIKLVKYINLDNLLGITDQDIEDAIHTSEVHNMECESVVIEPISPFNTDNPDSQCIGCPGPDEVVCHAKHKCTTNIGQSCDDCEVWLCDHNSLLLKVGCIEVV